jgi:hypothetical protein
MKSVLAYEGADEMHTVALVRSMQDDPRSTDRARPKTARLPLFTCKKHSTSRARTM